MSYFNTEFGLGYSFASYRGRGSVPASGTIYFSQMYGAANRDPVSGDYYTLNSWEWAMNPTGGGDGQGHLQLRWNGAMAYTNGIHANVTSITWGDGWTYYRSTWRVKSGLYDRYGVYRIKN
jgi:hypothetical protein